MRKKSWIIIVSTVLAIIGTLILLVGPSPRCYFPNSDDPVQGLSARELISSGEKRCYHLFLPAELDLSKPAPIILSLHGYGSKPEYQAFITRWNEIAGVQGYIVVYPQGSSFPLRWNSFSDDQPDDVRFMKDILRDIGQFAEVDGSRIFVVGMSNGGAMAHQIACQMADEITAIGVVAGPNVELSSGCQPSRPVPVIAFYGTADPVVSYEGGTIPVRRETERGTMLESVEYPSAEIWASNWAHLNGCRKGPSKNHPSTDTLGFEYQSCINDAQVILYAIQDGGHTWPGGPEIPYLGKTSRGVDASTLILEFFSKY